LAEHCAHVLEADAASRQRLRIDLVNGRLSEVKPSTRIGVSAGLTFRIVGGYGKFFGRKADAALIADSVSLTVPSMARLRSNCRVIWLKPSALADVIWVRPGIWPNCSSSGVVTEDAMVCGSVPGSCAVTCSVG
jgi:hypothetical protein